MIGELVLIDEMEYADEEFEIGVSPYDFSLQIYVDEENTLEKQLKNREAYDRCTNSLKEFWEINGEENEYISNQMDLISENFDNLFDSVKYIRLLFEKTDCLEFIKNNPLLQTKRIVLSEILDISEYEKLSELINKYREFKDNIYISLSGNRDYVSLEECNKTMEAIKQQAESIKQLGLSPMETIMYVYDQVRNRVYQFENEDETSFKSRDLSKVLFGDKIVCAGYANIFQTILSYIGIDNNMVFLKEKNNPNSGHARNVIYVKDPKYNIDGVYYFDATWNSKRKNETNQYLYRYTYFAKTRKEMDEDDRFDFEDEYFPIYSEDMYNTIKIILESGHYDRLKKYIKSINYMSRLVLNEQLISPLHIIPMSPVYGQFDKEEVLNKLKDILSKFNKKLSAETLLNVLNNTRKIEYYQNPEFYPYSLEDFYKTCYISNWEFKDNHFTDVDRLLINIFQVTDRNLDLIDVYKNYGHESGLFKNIEGVKLTRELRRILEQKKTH